MDEVLDGAEIVVTTANAPEYIKVLETMKPGQKLLDFARMPGAEGLGDQYDGFLW